MGRGGCPHYGARMDRAVFPPPIADGMGYLLLCACWWFAVSSPTPSAERIGQVSNHSVSLEMTCKFISFSLNIILRYSRYLNASTAGYFVKFLGCLLSFFLNSFDSFIFWFINFKLIIRIEVFWDFKVLVQPRVICWPNSVGSGRRCVLFKIFCCWRNARIPVRTLSIDIGIWYSQVKVYYLFYIVCFSGEMLHRSISWENLAA